MRNELRPLRTTCKPLRNRYPAKVGLLGVTCLTMVSYQINLTKWFFGGYNLYGIPRYFKKCGNNYDAYVPDFDGVGFNCIIRPPLQYRRKLINEKAKCWSQRYKFIRL